MYYAGGRKVVLKFFDPLAAKTYLDTQYNWNKWFSWLKFGILEDYNFERLAWIRIHGLPIYLRFNENVGEIANNFGKVLKVDGRNWHNSNPTYFCVCILYSGRKLINEEVTCSYNGKSFKVGVVECAEAWDPISYYYEGESQATDRERC